MIFKDILVKAAEIIGDSDIDFTAPEEKTEKLISCGKMIYTELTEEYVHLKHKEMLPVNDGRIYYSEFTKAVKDVMKIKKDGVICPFTLYPLFVAVEEEGDVEVSYVYHAEEPALEEELDLPPIFTSSVLSVGVASEYFYRSGLIDEAVFYKNRYDNSLLNLTRKRGYVKLRYRRFI